MATDRTAASAVAEARANDLGCIVDGFRSAAAKERCRRVCAVLPHKKAASVGSPSAGTALPGRPTRRGRRRDAYWVTSPISAILPPRNGERAMLRRSPSCAIFTLPMPKPDGW